MSWGTRTVASWSRPSVPGQRRPRSDYVDPHSTHEKPVYRDAVPCRLYLIYVLDPRTDFTTLTLGYVGETIAGREFIRFGEHVGNGTASRPGDPWGDTIPEPDPQRAIEAGTYVVLDPPYDCKEDVWVAERAAVAQYRPLYNDEYNRHNPDRIVIPAARRARADRDRRRGIPRASTWAALYEQHLAAKRAGSEVPAGRSWWRPGRFGAAAWWRMAWFAGWLAGTFTLWWLAVRYLPVVSTARLGIVSGLLVAVPVLWWTRPRRGRWRRLGNRTLRAGLLLLAVFLLLWPLVDQLARHAGR